MYTSKSIQNELIAVIGQWIQKKLMQDLQEGSKIFSILADESADCSNQEQMALIIRYVNAHKEIQEVFLGVIECEEGTTGMQLATLIKSTCQTLHLDLSLCRGQGYDGAGNMSRKTNGAAAIIQSEFPKAMYFHCASHKLNLCVVHSCKLTSVTNMMDAITCLANFFNYSPQREKGLEHHLKVYPDAQKSKRLPLCATRWVERLDALEVTLVTEPVIFPNIYHLLSILAVIPATTCEVEWCFSSLRRLKTYIRSTMGDGRLTGLALMHVHQHIDEIVNDFATMHPRRMKLANIFED